MTLYAVIYVLKGDDFNYHVDMCHDKLTAAARKEYLKPRCVEIEIFERLQDNDV